MGFLELGQLGDRLMGTGVVMGTHVALVPTPSRQWPGLRWQHLRGRHQGMKGQQ